jgi:hypothetical protein
VSLQANELLTLKKKGTTIMKKIYLTPNVLVKKIELQRMIASSQPSAVIDPTAGPVNAEDVESRSFSIWDDEE